MREARRIPRGDSTDPAPWMADFARRAVSIRVQQLRSGGERRVSWVKSGFFGAIPFVSSIVGLFYDSTKTFRLVAIGAVGLGDSDQAARLRAQAKEVTRTSWKARVEKGAEWVGKNAFEHWWDNSDFAAAVQEHMVQALAAEFGVQSAHEFAGYAVHLKPGLGQAISAGRAVYTCDQKMLRALEWLHPVALQFHLETFVVNALSEVWGE
ncbi:uncharacterized protein E0L32_007139 [Thyridium curvatum]|uniref:Uncharacterized protein n=1 Tax=Thyridium curvatum TaxID=1093900 RepID=A0A507AX19_9PEZI|nr:uncharacterized protein E0L32_007139 [Thyridium curvatum]TPX12253.1 hypothetical protein E0L32_007139 [Thyridium curvatum]